MSDLGNLDGVSNVFTLQGKSVETRMVKELQDSVIRANGRPMDVNMLIFEFQSDAMQKAITDIARQNPNVTFRVIADSGQASTTGGNALPELVKLGLPNIQVKFKKDFPYVWNPALGRPDLQPRRHPGPQPPQGLRHLHRRQARRAAHRLVQLVRHRRHQELRRSHHLPEQGLVVAPRGRAVRRRVRRLLEQPRGRPLAQRVPELQGHEVERDAGGPRQAAPPRTPPALTTPSARTPCPPTPRAST